jgi:uncharacterized protein (DUF1778 family)
MAATTEITFRLSPEDKELIKRGAELEGTSVSMFLRLAALERMREIMKALEPPLPTTLPAHTFEQLMASIDEPDPISPEMKERFIRARETLGALQLQG